MKQKEIRIIINCIGSLFVLGFAVGIMEALGNTMQGISTSLIQTLKTSLKATGIFALIIIPTSIIGGFILNAIDPFKWNKKQEDEE